MVATIVFPEATQFKSIVEALYKLVDECLVRFDSEGMKLRALDPAHVSLISVYIPSTAFEEYDVDGEARFGFITSNLLKLLKRASKGSRLVLNVGEDKVDLEFRGVVKKTYTFTNLDVAEVDIPESRLQFNVEAIVLSDPIRNAVRDAEVLGDTLEFKAENEEELVLRSGEGESSFEARISRESGALISLRVDEPSKSKYSIEHLKSVLALTRVADTVEVNFSTNMPLNLKFPLPGEGRVEFLLAPKIE